LKETIPNLDLDILVPFIRQFIVMELPKFKNKEKDQPYLIEWLEDYPSSNDVHLDKWPKEILLENAVEVLKLLRNSMVFK
jgi:hypothetical protein